MGFGGSASINVVMKNNRNLLSNPKREKFKYSYGLASFGKKPEFNFPEATPKVLSDIRERLLLENELIRRRRIIALIAIGSVLITGFVIIMFN